MTVDFNEKYYIDFIRRQNHLRVWANLFVNEKPIAPSEAPTDFIFDPGAVMTVLTLSTAKELKYDLLPVKRTAKLEGFVPGAYLNVDYKVIHGIAIAGFRLSKITVAIPNPDDSNADRINSDLLGQNVLEYFNYYMDTENDKIFFKKNLKPKPISEDTKCGVVFLIDDD
ncbi:MAG: retroviral-like aspartic protease family protein [Oscillospiraceae bacterium]|jgi:hypothetical protein|nr:retroviral-like aspartic protease family protein [Oscillospiraceae bacterium]